MEKQYQEIIINDQTFYLVGTAHVSKNSVDNVERLIEEIKPDAICIELDSKRYDSITNPKKWEDTDIIELIKNKQLGLLMVSTLLASYQKRVATDLNSTSGAEIVMAINKAKENNIELVLVDRSVQTTFTRIWRKQSLFQKAKLLSNIVFSMFSDESISEEDLLKLQQSDVLEVALKDLGDEFKVVKEVLVDERDQFISSKIKTAKGQKVMAILGAAHLPGVQKNIHQEINTKELELIPDKTIGSKFLGYIIPITIVLLVSYTFMNNQNLGLQQIQSWFLWNGVLSAIGVIIAQGHILAVITALIVSPFTSLNPLLAAGWFAGLVQALIKKPTVKDFTSLNEAVYSISGVYQNRVTKILLIIILANVFSSIATIVSGLDIFNTFLQLFA